MVFLRRCKVSKRLEQTSTGGPRQMLVCGAEAGNAPSGGAYGRTDSSSPVPGTMVSWPSSRALSNPATPIIQGTLTMGIREKRQNKNMFGNHLHISTDGRCVWKAPMTLQAVQSSRGEVCELKRLLREPTKAPPGPLWSSAILNFNIIFKNRNMEFKPT